VREVLNRSSGEGKNLSRKKPERGGKKGERGERKNRHQFQYRYLIPSRKRRGGKIVMKRKKKKKGRGAGAVGLKIAFASLL